MRSVLDQIADQKIRFADHSIFDLLREGTLDDFSASAPLLSFWVMEFQDILRLIESGVGDARLGRIARQHAREDRGHHIWYLRDLQRLAAPVPDLAGLFGPRHSGVRAASYALVSEVFRATTDVEKIVLVEALEAAGNVYFSEVVNFMERVSYEGNLEYFARSHLEVEEDHEIHHGETGDFLASIQISDHERRLCSAMVDRVFRAFHQMFDALVENHRDPSVRPRATATELAP